MSLEVQIITNQTDWEKLVLAAHPNTFLQSWAWGETQLADNEQIQRLVVLDHNHPIALATVILVNARRGRHYLIPHGPLYLQPDLTPQALDAIIAHLNTTASIDHAVALRIAPLLLTSPDSKQLFKSRNFHPAPLHVHTELTWVLDISRPSDELLAGMRKTTRHAIRKAEQAGISCEIITDISALDRFWPLYDKTRQRHGFVPFNLKFLTNQWHAFESHNHIFAVIARYHDQDVAAGIFIDYAGTVFYHHGASLKLPSNVPAAHAVQWHAIQEAQHRGATNFNFWGIAPANQPNHPFTGIRIFKTGFGGQAFDYLHAQDLPFSWRYWFLWGVDTYRKYRRGFA